MSQSISKSQFLKGIQCTKALWYYRNRKDLAKEIDEAQQAIFDRGTDIGKLAHQYFKGGVEVEAEYWDIKTAVSITEDFVSKGQSIIFEAAAESEDGLYSKIDVLKKIKGKNEWDMIEVKGSASVKGYHISDMAAQRYAFEGAGYKIRKSILMHINSDYVRKGDLDIKELFHLEDCTAEVKEFMGEVGYTLPKLLSVLKKKKEPEVSIGSHCDNPFTCDYVDHCWKHIPDYSVYDVTSGKKLEALLDLGIVDVKKIPGDFKLGKLKAIDVDAYKSNKKNVDPKALKDWIGQLKYPLYFLDYETIGPAVPLFDGTSPFRQYPFQYSLHVQQNRGGSLEHREFLHTEQSDPRPSFVEQLISDCGKKGSIIVYNLSFEAGVNESLAKKYRKFASDLRAINERMVDLIIPFRSRHLYHPKQQGSASIKAALPAFVPDMSYEELDIPLGTEASRLGELIIAGQLPESDFDRVVNGLREYCKQDTFAMVRLLQVIYEHI